MLCVEWGEIGGPYESPLTAEFHRVQVTCPSALGLAWLSSFLTMWIFWEGGCQKRIKSSGNYIWVFFFLVVVVWFVFFGSVH